MALVNGTNYDHIDLHAASGGDVTRHKLQDTDGRAMVAPTEASSTASAAHPAGSYFIYNNKLYQATSDIASGGTITPNTNCKAVTLGSDVSDLKSALNQLDDIIYPYDPVLVTEADDFALDATFKNFDMTLLKKNNKYRINLAFSAVPAGLSTIRTATGTSGSTIVDNITDLFVGESWTEGKYIDYTPSVDGVRYLRIQFNSAYQGTYTADISVYDLDPAEKTALDTIDERIDSALASISSLNGAVDQIDSIIYPNEPILVKSEIGYALDASFKNFNTSTLLLGHKYSFTIKFSVYPQTLSSIQTATGESGSSIVDNITSLFVGDSWTEGKTVEYTPPVAGITYLRIGFNSSYQGTYTADIYVYDITDISKTEFETINNEIDETNDNVADLYKLQNVVNLSNPYNLLPPDGYTVNKSIDRGTGELVDSTGKVASDYIEIDPTQGYICNNTKTSSITYDPITGTANSGNMFGFDRFSYAFYDKDKAYIPYISGADATSKEIPQNAKYIRVTVVSEEVYPIARLIYGNYQDAPIVRIVQYKKVPPKYYDKPSTGFENFEMIMFGDSITHGSLSVSDDGTSYVDFASDYLNSNIINVGFGGTRATYTLSGAGLFCFYHLCECIVSSNANAWDDLVSYAENENTTYLPHLQKLMAVDWSKVNAIGLMYGANDFTSNTPVGSEYNETVTNYDGAIAYGIKLLVEKYPHLQVLILAPFDRMMDATDPETMTDTTPNNAGLYMYDYADSLIHVAKHFHCPRINTDDLFQMDQYRILLYASDGTHPRSNIAQFRLGWLFAQTIKRYLSPV